MQLMINKNIFVQIIKMIGLTEEIGFVGGHSIDHLDKLNLLAAATEEKR